MWDVFSLVFGIFLALYAGVGVFFVIYLSRARSEFRQLGIGGKIFIFFFWWLWFILRDKD